MQIPADMHLFMFVHEMIMNNYCKHKMFTVSMTDVCRIETVNCNNNDMHGPESITESESYNKRLISCDAYNQ